MTHLTSENADMRTCDLCKHAVHENMRPMQTCDQIILYATMTMRAHINIDTYICKRYEEMWYMLHMRTCDHTKRRLLLTDTFC